MLQVPANRIGHGQFSLAQLKIIQEVIMGEQLKWDYLWAALCHTSRRRSSHCLR